MTLYDFIALDDEAKANSVWDGIHLENRFDGEFDVMLYDLGGFYVEVYYNSEINQIVRLRPFSKVSNVEPYLKTISINEVQSLL